MHINDFPQEILSNILEEASKLNERDGVTFTFGLSQAPTIVAKPPLQKYVRGPVQPDILRWDAASAIREVCRRWHEWALEYAMKDVFIRKWKGAERWAELSPKRGAYGIYELIEKPSGAAVYRDPYCTLRKTVNFLDQTPGVAEKVRRLWLNGFHIAETNSHLFSFLSCCSNLTAVSISWTMVRHLSAEQWTHILRVGSPMPLQSLELQATTLRKDQANDPKNRVDLRPLESELVDFSKLRKLKLFGTTTFMPLNDQDMYAIARTATNLEEFHLTCLDTVGIDGVMAIVRASHSTLRVLEHSPRSNGGFFHPHPGSPSNNEHLCTVLSSMPKLETLSISVPSMCPALFANPEVRWTGDCQVRAARLCEHDYSRAGTAHTADAMRDLLSEARRLSDARARAWAPAELAIELFFADCIFEPHIRAVHGDFQIAEIDSAGEFPLCRMQSRKGPYGSTGLYAKDEEGVFERVDEAEWLEGVRRGWVNVGVAA
ncbi:uncharacterized protein K452DRAFT_355055 [Aplosporella prunicola CBS 121167]|uniref:Uncharacterized protein n=1 Tax=Aplosporella prunicola CBS 121167 TaxID=1176127 RepID=A0A6A6BT64_9PEZI|nr:uncharacterized protein K452DRAFT_355055 [Aplosporella prunicola CBS 121167]KAF2146573.1 hypothetical protein K452DRAFT_355055 [Aplosporella prunicola CBS 121167]